jgi:acetylornithine/N-succinyldiaminopimelate aminotransferase
MPSVERPKQVFVRGQGSWLWDNDDRAYLDFSQAGGANSLGHSPRCWSKPWQPGPGTDQPRFRAAQPRHAQPGRALCASTGSDQAYLLNSGSEACEAAIKLARKWGQLHRGGASRIMSPARLSWPQPGDDVRVRQFNLHNRFEPQLPGFSRCRSTTSSAARGCGCAHRGDHARADPERSRVIPATEHYLKGVERLCRELGILLILDEVQTGIGRCGTLLAEQSYGVRADIVVLGKGWAVVCRWRRCWPGARPALMPVNWAALITAMPDDRGRSGGARQRAGPGFLEHVGPRPASARRTARLAHRYGHGELRGQGLFWGLSLSDDSADAVVKAALHEGLLLNAPQADCLRFTPALTVSKANIDEMLLRLARAFSRVRTAQLQCRKGIAV